MSPEVLGLRLRDKRRALKLTIRELAEKAWVSKTSIVNMEQGKSFRASTLIKVAGAMGLHVGRFLSDDDGPVSSGARPHYLSQNRWFSLENEGAGPVGDGVTLGPEERRRLMAERGEALMSMFSNVPLNAGLIAGLVELTANTSARSHPGHEFIYVLKGKLLVEISDERYELGPGESLYFEGASEHAYGPADGSELPVSVLMLRVD